MKSRPKRKNQMIFAAAGSLLSIIGATDSYAAAPDSLIEEIKRYGFTVGAWANAGITYNATDPGSNYNGPVVFADRSGEFQLNQLNAYVQRAVATEGSKWDIGGRADVMFGTDAPYTQAFGTTTNGGSWDLGLLNNGSNRFYGLAVPQLYAEIYAPFGNGLTIKVGHFYTSIGYESVPSPDNFFYTHAYTMQFGEPFTHTGFTGSYNVNNNWSVLAGAVTGSETGGWDGNFDQQLGNWAGLGGVTWTSDSAATSVNVSGTYGERSETSSQHWAMYSIVAKHDITEKTHLVLQHDHGFAGKVADGGLTDAEWYGVNSHLYYDINDEVTVGLRGEWFRDHNGVRVFSPARQNGSAFPASYYEVTAGVTWKPRPWLRLRPNVRYDWVGDTTGKPYDIDSNFVGQKKDQFTFSTDVTVTF